MKLFVDDIRNAPDESWSVARTNEQAVQALAMFQFAEVSLDHDMEGTPETFKPTAYFLGAKYTGSTKAPKITLHTANPDGASRMKNILKQYGISCEIRPIYDQNG